MNRVILAGNVGRDPEIRSTNDGTKLANLSLATSERWKDRNTGERKEKTEWNRVVVWGPLVDVVEKYVSKGDKLLVVGQLETRKWTDQAGTERYSTEVVLRGPRAELEMLGGGKGGGERRGQSQDGWGQSPGKQVAGSLDDLDDEIPF